MDTALPQKFPFILDRNLAKANCTGNLVCMSCDIVVLVINIIFFIDMHLPVGMMEILWYQQNITNE